MSQDAKTITSGLSRSEARRRYPRRPKVRGEHFGLWEWRGKSAFTGTIAEAKVHAIPRHAVRSFPERLFAELEELGFRFVRWAAA